MHLPIPILLALLLSFAPALFAADSGVVRLASTTSTSSSGLLDLLLPVFARDSGYRVEPIIIGTGRALRMGRLGEVDAVLVHSPDAEKQFVADGWGSDRREIMQNDFIIVGPADDPADVRGLRDVTEALSRIASGKASFASRGDDSGTHKKEMACWSVAGIEPFGDWYYETGSSMGATLQLASEQGYYTLVDRGTWLAARRDSPLQLLVEGDPDLQNRYSIVLVNPNRHEGINSAGATALADWLSSPSTLELIMSLKIDGEQLFFPPGTPDN